MKTLHTHNLEMEKKFDEKFVDKIAPTGIGIVQTDSDTILNFITNQNKQLYIKIAEGELERLEEMIRTERKLHTPNCLRGTCKNNHFFCSFSEEDDGYNDAIQDSIDNWNNILQELNK